MIGCRIALTGPDAGPIWDTMIGGTGRRVMVHPFLPCIRDETIDDEPGLSVAVITRWMVFVAFKYPWNIGESRRPSVTSVSQKTSQNVNEVRMLVDFHDWSVVSPLYDPASYVARLKAFLAGRPQWLESVRQFTPDEMRAAIDALEEQCEPVSELDVIVSREPATDLDARYTRVTVPVSYDIGKLLWVAADELPVLGHLPVYETSADSIPHCCMRLENELASINAFLAGAHTVSRDRMRGYPLLFDRRSDSNVVFKIHTQCSARRPNMEVAAPNTRNWLIAHAGPDGIGFAVPPTTVGSFRFSCTIVSSRAAYRRAYGGSEPDGTLDVVPRTRAVPVDEKPRTSHPRWPVRVRRSWTMVDSEVQRNGIVTPDDLPPQPIPARLRVVSDPDAITGASHNQYSVIQRADAVLPTDTLGARCPHAWILKCYVLGETIGTMSEARRVTPDDTRPTCEFVVYTACDPSPRIHTQRNGFDVGIAAAPAYGTRHALMSAVTPWPHCFPPGIEVPASRRAAAGTVYQEQYPPYVTVLADARTAEVLVAQMRSVCRRTIYISHNTDCDAAEVADTLAALHMSDKCDFPARVLYHVGGRCDAWQGERASLPGAWASEYWGGAAMNRILPFTLEPFAWIDGRKLNQGSVGWFRCFESDPRRTEHVLRMTHKPESGPMATRTVTTVQVVNAELPAKALKVHPTMPDTAWRTFVDNLMHLTAVQATSRMDVSTGWSLPTGDYITAFGEPMAPSRWGAP
jgi:hypothetical protein